MTYCYEFCDKLDILNIYNHIKSFSIIKLKQSGIVWLSDLTIDGIKVFNFNEYYNSVISGFNIDMIIKTKMENNTKALWEIIYNMCGYYVNSGNNNQQLQLYCQNIANTYQYILLMEINFYHNTLIHHICNYCLNKPLSQEFFNNTVKFYLNDNFATQVIQEISKNNSNYGQLLYQIRNKIISCLSILDRSNDIINLMIEYSINHNFHADISNCRIPVAIVSIIFPMNHEVINEFIDYFHEINERVEERIITNVSMNQMQNMNQMQLEDINSIQFGGSISNEAISLDTIAETILTNIINGD